MEQNISMRLLRERIQDVQHLLRTEDDLTSDDREQAGLLLEVLDHSIKNLQRAEVDQRQGTLNDLVCLKYAMRIAGVLLEQVQEREAEEMKGWRFGRPVNAVQRGYDFLYELAMALGASIAQVEGLFPQCADYFAWEREEYSRLCDEQPGQLPDLASFRR